jgi:hypothetical protein
MNPILTPVGLMAGRRRPRRIGHVLVTIEDLLILAWQVPMADLRRLLPVGLEPLARNGHGLFSALVFRNRRLRPAVPGFPSWSCVQLNLRSHILDPSTGGSGSVFFHCFMLSQAWLAWLGLWASRIPCQSAPMRLTCNRAGSLTGGGDDGDSSKPVPSVDFQATSDDHSVEIRARKTDHSPFLAADFLDQLTNVHTGYIQDPRSGVLRCWDIWHRRQLLQRRKPVDQGTSRGRVTLG